MNRTFLFTCEGCGASYEKGDTPRNRRRVLCRKCALPRGANHPGYRGGVMFDTHAKRWRVICRDGTRMTYARALMCGHLGRMLRPDEHVHHLNGDQTDDRLENLAVIGIVEHGRIHGYESGVVRRQRRAAA